LRRLGARAGIRRQSFLPLCGFGTAEGRKAARQQVLEILRDDVVGVVRIDRRQQIQPRVCQAVQFPLKSARQKLLIESWSHEFDATKV